MEKNSKRGGYEYLPGRGTPGKERAYSPANNWGGQDSMNLFLAGTLSPGLMFASRLDGVFREDKGVRSEFLTLARELLGK